LGVPHVSCAIKVGEVTGGCMIAERMTEEGLERIKLPLPALITVPKGINEPRFPSLKGKIGATRSEITVWSARDIGADVSRIGLRGSPTTVVKVSAPRRRRAGRILQGTLEQQVEALLSKLREANVL